MCVLARGLVAVDLVDSCESDTLIRYDKYQLACECTCRVLILILLLLMELFVCESICINVLKVLYRCEIKEV